MRWGVASASALVVLAAAAPAAADREYRVEITSAPEGAEIRVDDPDAEPIGTTPYEGTMPAGPYMVILDLDGHMQVIEQIDVQKRRKKQTFDFTLEPIPVGKVELAAADGSEGARITIDGEPVGEVPTTVEMAEGPHQIVIKKEGFKRFEKWVEVIGGESSTLKIELESLNPGVEEKKDEPDPPRVAPLVVGSAAVQVAWRRWDYENGRTMSARPFDANLVPVIRGALELHPLAGSTNAALHGLGARAAFGLGLPPAADTGSGTGATIETSWSELELGGFYRHALTDAAGVRIDVAWQRSAFGFEQPGMFADEVPDVDYRTVRLGVTGDYTSGDVRAALSLSFLPVLSAGIVADRFAESSASGVDLEGGLWYGITDALRAGASAGYRRFLFDFTSMSGDPVEADGGTDIYFSLTAGAAYLY